mgnify:CR=1 FL=1
MKSKCNNGITLIALIITIIILLILAGITISMLTGDNGILKQASNAKLENQKAEYKEIINLAQMENDITTDANRTKKEKLNGIYDILIKNNEFKDAIIIKKYENEEEPKLVIKTKEGWIYIVTVNGIEETENEDIETEIIINNGDIKYDYFPDTWTNTEVKVGIKVENEKFKEYTLQYSLDGITWQDYVEKLIIQENNTEILARLINKSLISKNYATGNVTNIDKILPKTEINLSDVTTTTGNAITANIIQSDNESGIDITNCKWVYNTTQEKIGIDSNKYTDGILNNENQTISLEKMTAGKYYLHVLTVDIAGNKIETVSNEVTVNSASKNLLSLVKSNPAEWYGKKVSGYVANGVSDWKIFYNDDQYVYLIMEDYLESQKAIECNNTLLNASGDSTTYKYCVYWGNIPERDATNYQNKFTPVTTEVLEFDYAVQGGMADRCGLTLLDTSKWTSFVDNNKANSAIGTPSLNMWVASYNIKYPENKVYTNTDNFYRILCRKKTASKHEW